MKIILLVWNRESIMSAIGRGLEKDGHEVLFIHVDAKTVFSNLVKTIDSFKPDFCLTHNFYVFDSWREHGEAFENYLKTKGIPVGTWYWDSPQISGYYKLIRRFTFGPNFPNQILFFVVDKFQQDWLAQRGISASLLPIGVNEEFFSRSPPSHLKAEFEVDISFVGKPCHAFASKVDKQEELWRDYLHLTANDFYNLIGQMNDTPNGNFEKMREQLKVVGQIFYEFFKAPIYTAEECIDRSEYCLNVAEKILPPELFYEYQIYSGRLEFFYSWYQLNYLLISLLRFDLHVYGGDIWSEKLLPNFKYKSPLLSDDELHACFAYSRISFCHTKWQFKTGVHERPLLVLAAGGFPLTDYRSGIDDLFKSGEIAVYHDEEELLDLTHYYLNNESERLKISKRGRERVLKDHTYHQRSKTIVAEMKRHFNL